MAAKDESICSQCNSRRLLSRCEGCRLLLCPNHALAHRDELTDQLNKIVEQNQHLYSSFLQHEQSNEHPLFSQIEVWKHDSIKKIHLAAEKARHDLLLLLVEDKQRTKTNLETFKNGLQTAKEEDHFTEIDLNSWKDELIKIKAQMETPVNTEWAQDRRTSPIQLMKIRKRKETSSVPVAQKTATIETRLIPDTVAEEAEDIRPIAVQCPADDPPKEQVQPKEAPVEAVPAECPTFLDPKKNKTLLLYGSQMNMPGEFSLNLKRFAGDHLEIFQNFDDVIAALTEIEQASIIFYLPIEECEAMVAECVKNDRLHSVYIRDKLPDSKGELADFSRKYPKVRGIADNDLSLLSRWVMDSAGDYRVHADLWIAQGNKDKARDCFQQSIQFFKSLSQLFRDQKRTH